MSQKIRKITMFFIFIILLTILCCVYYFRYELNITTNKIIKNPDFSMVKNREDLLKNNSSTNIVGYTEDSCFIFLKESNEAVYLKDASKKDSNCGYPIRY